MLFLKIMLIVDSYNFLFNLFSLLYDLPPQTLAGPFTSQQRAAAHRLEIFVIERLNGRVSPNFDDDDMDVTSILFQNIPTSYNSALSSVI
jgi:hypothetical protein